tara:strand:+ start:1417 stop:1740 length:324 start_codon:yes stop_codon:yes gene_type:complete
MAKTLWSINSIVCLEGIPEFPYKLLNRVTDDHKSAIGIYNLLTCSIEWAFLQELEYLDKPETIMEYYNAVQRKNSKPVRRAKKSSTVYRGGTTEKPEREQISGSTNS